MKKSKLICLVLITAALASCNRTLWDTDDGEVNDDEKNNAYMRSDSTEYNSPFNNYNIFSNLYFSISPYYGYYNSPYPYGGGYNAYRPFEYNNRRFYHSGYNNNHLAGGHYYSQHTTRGGFGHHASASHSSAS